MSLVWIVPFACNAVFGIDGFAFPRLSARKTGSSFTFSYSPRILLAILVRWLRSSSPYEYSSPNITRVRFLVVDSISAKEAVMSETEFAVGRSWRPQNGRFDGFIIGVSSLARLAYVNKYLNWIYHHTRNHHDSP